MAILTIKDSTFSDFTNAAILAYGAKLVVQNTSFSNFVMDRGTVFYVVGNTGTEQETIFKNITVEYPISMKSLLLKLSS